VQPAEEAMRVLLEAVALYEREEGRLRGGRGGAAPLAS